jgi:hypothetical protein
MLEQYVLLWHRLQDIQLVDDTPDRFIWKWSTNQQYFSTSGIQSLLSWAVRHAWRQQSPQNQSHSQQ